MREYKKEYMKNNIGAVTAILQFDEDDWMTVHKADGKIVNQGEKGSFDLNEVITDLQRQGYGSTTIDLSKLQK